MSTKLLIFLVLFLKFCFLIGQNIPTRDSTSSYVNLLLLMCDTIYEKRLVHLSKDKMAQQIDSILLIDEYVYIQEGWENKEDATSCHGECFWDRGCTMKKIPIKEAQFFVYNAQDYCACNSTNSACDTTFSVVVPHWKCHYEIINIPLSSESHSAIGCNYLMVSPNDFSWLKEKASINARVICGALYEKGKISLIHVKYYLDAYTLNVLSLDRNLLNKEFPIDEEYLKMLNIGWK